MCRQMGLDGRPIGCKNMQTQYLANVTMPGSSFKLRHLVINLASVSGQLVG